MLGMQAFSVKGQTVHILGLWATWFLSQLLNSVVQKET